MEDIILYHGSKSGINGEISPVAGRDKCDFGKGFYMGTDLKQTESSSWSAICRILSKERAKGAER